MNCYYTTWIVLVARLVSYIQGDIHGLPVTAMTICLNFYSALIYT
jgi:hypothetical protein